MITQGYYTVTARRIGDKVICNIRDKHYNYAATGEGESILLTPSLATLDRYSAGSLAAETVVYGVYDGVMTTIAY